MALPPGLYHIIHVLNKELGLHSYASAHAIDGNPVVGTHIVGSAEHAPNLVRDWQVRPVDGSDGLYTIQALADRTDPPNGFTVPEVAPSAPVLYAGPPTAFRIQAVPEEDQGPDAHAYSIMVPVNTVGASFYLKQRDTREANPPVQVVAIPVIEDPPPVPYWIFKPIFVD